MSSKIMNLLIILSIAGCSIMAVKKHSPHYLNTRKLKKVNGIYKISNVVAEKKAAPLPTSDIKLAYQDNRPIRSSIENVLEGKSVQCRLTTFNLPAKMTVQTYLKETFEHELDAAEKLDPTKGKEIKILVKKLEVDTSSGTDGLWLLDIEYEVGGKKHLVSTQSAFESAFNAQAACSNAANTFSDAIAENFVTFMGKVE